jgi:hypothetical protein
MLFFPGPLPCNRHLQQTHSSCITKQYQIDACAAYVYSPRRLLKLVMHSCSCLARVYIEAAAVFDSWNGWQAGLIHSRAGLLRPHCAT